MHNFLHFTFRRVRQGFVFCALAGLVFAIGFSSRASAADSQGGSSGTQQPNTLTPKAAEEFGKINPLIEAKNWDAAFLIIRGIMTASAPGSYDLAMSNLMLAQTHLMRGSQEENDFIKAIAPMEHVVNSGFWPREKSVEWLFILAQLSALNKDNAKAESYVKQWLAETPKPTAEGYLFAATMIIQRAQQNIENIDVALIKEAQGYIDKGLLLGTKPHDQLLYLRVICHQSLGEFNTAAEQLEAILAKHPENKSYWGMLFGNYVQSQRMLHAILTAERAQKHGTMNTPKDNLTLVHLYYNLEQFDKAIELLEKGINDGTIEPTKENFDLLAFALQQMHRELKAIDVHKKAAEQLKTGAPYVQIANLWYNMRENRKALESIEEALRRGGVGEVAGLMIFAAHLAFELKELDKSAKLLDDAEPQIKTDQDRNQHKGLKAAVQDAIRVRDEEQKAAEAPTAG